MFSKEELRVIYIALLKQHEYTNQQIINYKSLLVKCKDNFEELWQEVQIRLLALNVQADNERSLLVKTLKLWKGGNQDEKKDASLC